ncbi:MAG TPA: hypothetical protein VFI96_08275 [Longimicrobiaceae bacterium]|nr:hypothetical protein [Longimicrobiaceae bacterium]
MRYGRDYWRSREPAADYVPHDPAIDYGYRRGGFMGSAEGRTDWRFGPGGRSSEWHGTAGRFGGGGPRNARGSSRMGVDLGPLGRGGPRRGMGPVRGMRYDIGYGMGNDREWY